MELVVEKMVKGSVRSVSTKPKRERKSELEKQVAKLELEAERKAASGGGAGAEATTGYSTPYPFSVHLPFSIISIHQLLIDYYGCVLLIPPMRLQMLALLRPRSPSPRQHHQQRMQTSARQ